MQNYLFPFKGIKMLTFDTYINIFQPSLISFKATLKTGNNLQKRSKKKQKKTYLIFPPHKWHLSPIQPGLHLHSPLFESQTPFVVQGWWQIIGSGVVAIGVSILSWLDVNAAIIVSAVEGEASTIWWTFPIGNSNKAKTKVTIFRVQFLSSFFMSAG